MRGLSRNKMCIGCAWDGKNLICIMEGFGKPSKKHTWESFSSHIKEGSKLIHDGENSHSLLVDKLNLSEEIHTTKETRGLKDKENPMDSINKQHAMLKKFLRAHSGFDRDDLQDYLNFFSFIASNPDQETLEKVKILLVLVSIIRKYCDIATKTAINAQNRRFSQTRYTKKLKDKITSTRFKGIPAVLTA